VPGLPVDPETMVQNTGVISHCLQLSQQAFNGHEFRLEIFCPLPIKVACVPGTRGPQTTFTIEAGISGLPVFVQIFVPANKLAQPDQPQVVP